MSIAFFDLDKTLIAENSAKLWLRAQWRSKQIRLSQMIRASYWLAKYHLGFTKIGDVIEKGLSLLEGENAKDVLSIAEDFYHNTLKDLYRPGALTAIKVHKDLGHKISLLTSSFDGLSALVQRDLSFDYCLCTRLEIDGRGQYTGKTIGPPCF